MIIVTGTRRAGTSMWMQVLAAAGFSVIGERYPGDWGSSLRSANPHGFFESLLRHGVYYRTNPHPVTGEYVRAEESTRHAVKVFIPGLIRSERAYLDRVLVTVRPWREYERSIQRLYELDDANAAEQAAEDPAAVYEPPPRMPPALEWWDENFALIRDLAVRRYACHVQSYDGALRDPRRVVTQTLAWIGHGGDVERAIAAVRPDTRTQRSRAREHDVPDSVEPEVAAVFDEFYGAIDRGGGLSGELIARMNQLHETLTPTIQEHQARIHDHHRARASRSRRPGIDDSPLHVLPGEWA